MLLNPDTEKKIETVLDSLASAFAQYAIGRPLEQAAVANADVTTIHSGSYFTFLDLAYLAGKVADLIGPNKVKVMSPQELRDATMVGKVEISKNDQVMVGQLRDTTARWLLNKLDKWKQQFRTEVNIANLEWAAAVKEGLDYPDQKRRDAQSTLYAELYEMLESYNEGMDTFIQSEIMRYFQYGQTVNLPGTELVYKIPRAAACEHCMRLHLNTDGSPVIYPLQRAREKSNWDKPPYQWQFVVGPTHPNCYCPMYRLGQNPAPGPDPGLAEVRRFALSKRQKKAQRAERLRTSKDEKQHYVLLKSYLADSLDLREL